MVVPRLRRIVPGLSLRRPGFALESVHMEFSADKVALGHVFLRVPRSSSVSIIPPWLSIFIIWAINNRLVVGRSSET
jgi:hypothetical protein